VSNGHYHTSAAWAAPQHPRHPAVEPPWRFVVPIGALAIGVSDEGVVLARVTNGMAARLNGELERDHAAIEKSRRDRYVEDGLCWCGNTRRAGRSNCQRCADSVARHAKSRRLESVATGNCGKCHARPLYPGRTACFDCLESARLRATARYSARKAARAEVGRRLIEEIAASWGIDP